MEINNSSQAAGIYRTAGSSLSPLSRSAGQRTPSNAEQVRRNASRTPDYTVNISSQGRSQSLAGFTRTQANEKSTFERTQNREETTKNRELANERQSFERKQASEARSFESKQRMEKLQFMRSLR